MSSRQGKIITLILVAFAAAQIALWVAFEVNTISRSQFEQHARLADAQLRLAIRGVCYRLNLMRWAYNRQSITPAIVRLFKPTDRFNYLRYADCQLAADHPHEYVPPAPVMLPLSEIQRLTHPPPVPQGLHGAGLLDGTT